MKLNYIISVIVILFCNSIQINASNIDSLINESHKTTNATVLTRINFEIYKNYINNNTDSAFFYLNIFIDLAKESNSKELIARSKRMLGVKNIFLGNYSSAIIKLKDALTYSLKNNITEESIVCYQNIGAANYYMNNFEKAKENYEKGISLSISNNNNMFVGDLFESIALIYSMETKIDSALIMFFNAEKAYFDEKKYTDLTNLYQNIGGLYNDFGFEEEALKYFNKSLNLCKEYNDKVTEGYIYMNSASIMNSIYGLDKAKKYLDDAHRIFTELKDSSQIMSTLTLKAILLSDNGLLNIADSLFLVVENLLLSKPDNYEEVKLLLYKGYHLKNAERFKNALLMFSKSSYLAKSNNFLDLYIKSKLGEIEVLNLILISGDEQEISRIPNSSFFENKNDFFNSFEDFKNELIELRDIKSLAILYDFLASYHKYKKDYKKAYNYLKKWKTATDTLNSFNETKMISKLSLDLDKNKLDKELAEKNLELNKNKLAIQKSATQRKIYLLILTFTILFASLMIFINQKRSKIINKLQELNAKLNEKNRLNAEQKQIILKQNQEIKDELEDKKREFSSNLIINTSINNKLKEILKSLNTITSVPSNSNNKELNNIKKLIQSIIKNDDEWKSTKMFLNETQPKFIEHLKNKYPNLTTNDIKHCSFIKMGLSILEEAELLNVSYRTIESARYRLKKKMNLESDISLDNHILSLY